MEDCHVLAASDNNYLVGLYTTLASIVVANNLKDRFVFHVIDLGIHPEQKTKLQSFFKKFENVRLDLHTVDLSVFQGAKTGRLGLPAYARLYMGHVVASPRCIYIDVDFLAGRDLREIWNREMDGNIFLARHEDATFSGGAYSSLAADCPFEPKENVAHYRYFNTGFLLCDLDAYRRERVFEQALGLIQTHGDKCTAWDQTLLNYICRGKIGTLAPEWNTTGGSIEVLGENTNYHFFNARKPWDYTAHSPSVALWKLFYKIFIRSDFPHTPPWKARMRNLAFHLRTLALYIAPDAFAFIEQTLHPQARQVYDIKRLYYRHYRDNRLRGGLDPASREIYRRKKKQWRELAARFAGHF